MKINNLTIPPVLVRAIEKEASRQSGSRELKNERDAYDNRLAIPDIVDFTHIVCFGTSGDGAPFCLDYRQDSSKPSVLWWDDIYWRRIAPDVDSFLELFAS
ncbi:MAG: SMI1/KNR4 family protein [Leptospirales bacterium]|nr:SMI1/KNR4 family protein [Leptospirales bacterium]